MLFSFLLFVPPSWQFRALLGNEIFQSTNLWTRKKKKETIWLESSLSTERGQLLYSEISSSLPKGEVDLVLHKRTAIRPISASQRFETMLFMCMADKKQAKFSARQRSLQHGWGQPNPTQQLSEQSRMEGLPESWNIATHLLAVLFVFEQNRWPKVLVALEATLKNRSASSVTSVTLAPPAHSSHVSRSVHFSTSAPYVLITEAGVQWACRECLWREWVRSEWDGIDGILNQFSHSVEVHGGLWRGKVGPTIYLAS